MTDARSCFPARLVAAAVLLGALLVPAAGAANDGAIPGGAGRSSSVLDKLRGGAGSTQPDFLPVDKAFRVRLAASGPRTVVADFNPADGYYLYRDRFQFSLVDAGGVRIEKVELPRGEIKSDPNFGDTEVFHGPVQVLIRLDRKGGEAQRVTIQAVYQGCAEAGLCYPPESRRFDLQLAALAGDTGGAAPPMPAPAGSAPPLPAVDAAPAPAPASREADPAAAGDGERDCF